MRCFKFHVIFVSINILILLSTDPKQTHLVPRELGNQLVQVHGILRGWHGFTTQTNTTAALRGASVSPVCKVGAAVCPEKQRAKTLTSTQLPSRTTPYPRKRQQLLWASRPKAFAQQLPKQAPVEAGPLRLRTRDRLMPRCPRGTNSGQTSPSAQVPITPTESTLFC